jgi:CRISPR-associated protein Cmr4
MDQQYLGQGEAQLQLEERTFSRTGDISEGLVAALAAVCPDAQAAIRLARQLAIVTDRDFAWFARYGLPVQARNALDPDTKKSNALWFEETLPPDTLMYALVSARGTDAGSIEQLTQVFGDPAYLQIGGNETVGQGWFRVGWQAGGGGQS